MRFSYFDATSIATNSISKSSKQLSAYQAQIDTCISKHDVKKNEYLLAHAADPKLHETISEIKQIFKKVKHVILVGVGGSSLGVEAVHQVLDSGKVTLSVLDTVSAHNIEAVFTEVKQIKKLEELVVCVISKSGGTPETMTNASVLLEQLETKFGKKIYSQTIFIGNKDTDFMKAGKHLGVTIVTMPEIVGGRYSVATEVGLVPMALLGHDVDSYIAGFTDAAQPEFAALTSESAARVFEYMKKGYRHYNFFAFEPRLEKLGAWYRQLFAESLGKSQDKSKKPVTNGMLPTISTPVELHSVGQLYLSGFKGVYTDFVTFDDEQTDFKISKQGLAKKYGKFTLQEVTTALYGGVIGAYHEKQLPYRTTIFDDDLAYSLGMFMAMRMRETMCVAHLMNLNAFDQPNVELYKKKTKQILGL
jgi:glucose-6-phosphate isomerase